MATRVTAPPPNATRAPGAPSSRTGREGAGPSGGRCPTDERLSGWTIRETDAGLTTIG